MVLYNLCVLSSANIEWPVESGAPTGIYIFTGGTTGRWLILYYSSGRLAFRALWLSNMPRNFVERSLVVSLCFLYGSGDDQTHSLLMLFLS
ncbi:MAG: hypothetical protein QNK49_03610 [Porticoccus sp.]